MRKAKRLADSLLEADKPDARNFISTVRTGRVNLGDYEVTQVKSRTGEIGIPTGGVRMCSCGSRRIGVRWPTGELTWVCMKAVRLEGTEAVLEEIEGTEVLE